MKTKSKYLTDYIHEYCTTKDLDEKNQIIEPKVKVNQIQSNRITKTSRKVGAYDKDNNLIQEFDSLQLAAQFCGGNSSTISAVCRGKRKTHKNYIWRYLD